MPAPLTRQAGKAPSLLPLISSGASDLPVAKSEQAADGEAEDAQGSLVFEAVGGFVEFLEA